MNNNQAKKRSVRISGHYTSITMEDEFWDELKAIAKREKKSLSSLISAVDERSPVNLSGELRLLVLRDLKLQMSSKMDLNP